MDWPSIQTERPFHKLSIEFLCIGGVDITFNGKVIYALD